MTLRLRQGIVVQVLACMCCLYALMRTWIKRCCAMSE